MIKGPGFQILFSFAFIIANTNVSFAQKALQLEKGGSVRTTKIFVGESIQFKLKNDDTGWYERTIFDVNPKTGFLNLEGTEIHVDSIGKLRFSKRPFVPSLIGKTLQGGGINMILFDLSRGAIWDESKGFNSETIIAGAANFGVGTLIRKLFKRKKFRVGKRKRLRLIDVDFGPPVKPFT